MKASTLATVIVLYATFGALLAFATTGTVQGVTAATTGISLAFLLGALWPVHRGFPLVGLVIGLTMALAVVIYVMLWYIFPSSEHSIPHTYREQDLLRGVFVAAAGFGAWAFVMLVGAGAGWLASLALGRQRPAEVQA